MTSLEAAPLYGWAGGPPLADFKRHLPHHRWRELRRSYATYLNGLIPLLFQK